MNTKLGIGVIGCGNISAAYFRLCPLFNGIEIVACADINPSAAAARAAGFGVRAETVDELLAADDVDIVLNLTIPAVHFQVTRQALVAGKHVYSEKPYVLNVDEGLELTKIANDRGLRIGSAPDTFLGGAHQLVRSLIDQDAIGKITGGTCHVMSAGMEDWHPNPAFFFQPGAGPVLDLGPYYISNLVQLLGPVARVGAMTSIPVPLRTITSHPRRGEKIEVTTPTTIQALLEFATGAIITLSASWDVKAHGHQSMELYGSHGSLFVPDPNFFGGEISMFDATGKKADLPKWPHPFSVPNQEDNGAMLANYRAAGLADMAQAIRDNRPHRCSGDFALHVVEIMTAILKSGETGDFVRLETGCVRPEALGIAEAQKLMRQTSSG